MGSLPPVFVEFIGLTGGFKSAVNDVQREVAKVEKTGGGTFSKIGHAGSVAFAAIGIAAVGAAVKGVAMATTFQSKLELLHTAAGEAQSALGKIGDGAKQIADQTGVAWEQVLEGLYTVEKAGYRAAGALEVTRAAAEGATAEGVDMTTMTNALTSVMQTYHLKAADAVRVTNEMVAAAGESKTNMQDFAGSLSAVLPKAQAAGLSFAQVGGAIATLTQHGTSAQEATQELANTIGNLQNPSQIAQKEMQQLGLSVNDVEKNLGRRGLTGTLALYVQAITEHMGPSGLVIMDAFKKSQAAGQGLSTMLASMPPKLAALSQAYLNGSVSMKTYRTDIRNLGAAGYAQGSQFLTLSTTARGFNDLIKSGQPGMQTFAAALAKMLGGSTGLNTALMLTGENMPGFQQRVKNIAGAAQHAGKDISTWGATSKTLKVQLDQLKQTIETTLISVGQKLIPIVSSIVAWLMKHKTAVKDLAVVLVAGAAAYGVLRAGMLAYSIVAGTVKAVTFGLRAATMGYQAAMGLATVQTEAQAAMLEKSAVAQVAYKVAQIATTIATKAMAAAQWLLNAAMDANPIVLIVAALAALAIGLYEAYEHSRTFRDIVNDIGQALKTVWNTVLKPVADFIKNVWVAQWHLAVDALREFEQLPGQIVAVWKTVLAWFEKLPGRILGYLKDAGRWLLHIGEDIVHGLWTGITTAAKAVWDWWVFLPKMILRLVANAGSWLLGIGRDIIGGLVHGIEAGVGAIGTAFAHIWDGIEAGGKDVLNGIIGLLNIAIDGLNQIINGFNDATGGLSDVWSWTGIPSIPAVPNIPQIPYLAEGGVVTRPTLAMIGEAGREAVIPLDKYSGLTSGGSVVLQMTNVIQLDGREIQRNTEEHQLRQGLRRGGGNTYQPFSKGARRG